MTALRFTPLSLETRAEPSGRIEGLASTFDGPIDAYGDVVAPGAFADSLIEHQGRGSMPAMLWAHQQDRPVGRWTEMHETRSGLEVVGQLNMKTAAGREAFEMLSAGDVGGLSIGFRVPDDGASFAGDIRRLKKIDLAEISVVAIPANTAARVTAVKSFEMIRPATAREFAEAVQQMGFTRAQAAMIAKRGFPGADEAVSQSDELATVRTRLKALALEIRKG